MEEKIAGCRIIDEYPFAFTKIEREVECKCVENALIALIYDLDKKFDLSQAELEGVIIDVINGKNRIERLERLE